MKNSSGLPLSDEDLAEHIQAFIDIEESIAQVMKDGVDL